MYYIKLHNYAAVCTRHTSAACAHTEVVILNRSRLVREGHGVIYSATEGVMHAVSNDQGAGPASAAACAGRRADALTATRTTQPRTARKERRQEALFSLAAVV